MTQPVKQTNKIVESIKKGFADIQLVMQEGNYKLFLKQLIVIIVVFMGYRYMTGQLEIKQADIRGQIDALEAQQKSEKEYLSNKEKLLKLEPRFPDMEAKNDWLLRQVVAIFRDANMTPDIGSSQAEDTSNTAYTVATIPVTLKTSFANFGRLLADIESREEYVRVSDFSITKKTDVLGENEITLRLNTIFPKEKIANQVFKDTNVSGKKGEKKRGGKK